MTPIFSTLQCTSYEMECGKSIAVGLGGWGSTKGAFLRRESRREISNISIDARCRADPN